MTAYHKQPAAHKSRYHTQTERGYETHHPLAQRLQADLPDVYTADLNTTLAGFDQPEK